MAGSVQTTPKNDQNDDSFVTPETSVKKMQKKYFNDDDPVEEIVEVKKKPVVEEESDSDSDEAPEEESINDVNQKLKNEERRLEELKKQEQEQERSKRRERDEQLKKQTETRRERKKEQQAQEEKDEFLPDDLIEQYEQEKNQLTGISHDEIRQALQSQHIRLDQQEKKKPKSIYKKGPVVVQVLKKNKKTMAPPMNKSLDRQRDRFLYRKSVDRRAGR